jgi:hypothetical protein
VATEAESYVFHLKQIGNLLHPNDTKRAFRAAIDIVRPVLQSQSKLLYLCGVGIQDDVKILKQFAPDLKARSVAVPHRSFPFTSGRLQNSASSHESLDACFPIFP